MNHRPHKFGNSLPFSQNVVRDRNAQFGEAWSRLDRVQVLGDDDRDNGHSGCIVILIRAH